MAQFKPADHSRGDDNTIGGYAAVHDRPAAFEGSDGYSYSVELLTDATGDAGEPWGGYILFVRWARMGAQTPEGHLETDFLVRASAEPDARGRLGALPLSAVHDALEQCIAAHSDATPSRLGRGGARKRRRVLSSAR